MSVQKEKKQKWTASRSESISAGTPERTRKYTHARPYRRTDRSTTYWLRDGRRMHRNVNYVLSSTAHLAGPVLGGGRVEFVRHDRAISLLSGRGVGGLGEIAREDVVADAEDDLVWRRRSPRCHVVVVFVARQRVHRWAHANTTVLSICRPRRSPFPNPRPHPTLTFDLLTSGSVFTKACRWLYLTDFRVDSSRQTAHYTRHLVSEIRRSRHKWRQVGRPKISNASNRGQATLQGQKAPRLVLFSRVYTALPRISLGRQDDPQTPSCTWEGILLCFPCSSPRCFLRFRSSEKSRINQQRWLKAVVSLMWLFRTRHIRQ